MIRNIQNHWLLTPAIVLLIGPAIADDDVAKADTASTVWSWLPSDPAFLYLSVAALLLGLIMRVVWRDMNQSDGTSAYDMDATGGSILAKGHRAVSRMAFGTMRLLARVIDVSLVVGALMLLASGPGRGWFHLAKSRPGEAFFFVAIALVLWIFIEPLLLKRFQTTPGKYLFNIRLTCKSGERITYRQALKRSFRVWWRGLGFGIPLLMFFTMSVAFIRLVAKRETSWDRDGAFKVTFGETKAENATASSALGTRIDFARKVLAGAVATTGLTFIAMGIAAIVIFGLLPTSGAGKLLLVLLIGGMAGTYGLYLVWGKHRISK